MDTKTLVRTCPLFRGIDPEELAEYLCADRSVMTRELARMREEGILRFDKRTFTLNPDYDRERIL